MSLELENLWKSLKTFSLGPVAAAKRLFQSTQLALFCYGHDGSVGQGCFWRITKSVWIWQAVFGRVSPDSDPGTVSPGGVGVNDLPAADCVSFPFQRLSGENPFTHILTPAEMETDPSPAKKTHPPSSLDVKPFEVQRRSDERIHGGFSGRAECGFYFRPLLFSL